MRKGLLNTYTELKNKKRKKDKLRDTRQVLDVSLGHKVIGKPSPLGAFDDLMMTQRSSKINPDLPGLSHAGMLNVIDLESFRLIDLNFRS